MKILVVVPWHNASQLRLFLDAWSVMQSDERFIFQQDKHREGCARTKNKGIKAAINAGADVVIVLDDDCFPHGQTMAEFIAAHLQALEPQPVKMFEAITKPASRGTPYFSRTIMMPVAASMGFWSNIGDYDAPGQLVHGALTPMKFRRQAMHGRYFPLCGMNLAFRARDEWPWCQFIDVPRFDDIWQGLIWQRKAYADGKCFNLAGPIVQHSRQSNVWHNLRDEALNLEQNETLWQEVHRLPVCEYEAFLASLSRVMRAVIGP